MLLSHHASLHVLHLSDYFLQSWITASLYCTVLVFSPSLASCPVFVLSVQHLSFHHSLGRLMTHRLVFAAWWTHHVSELPNAAKNKIPDPITKAAFFTESHSSPGLSWAQKEQICWCWMTSTNASWWRNVLFLKSKTDNETRADVFSRLTCFFTGIWHHKNNFR